MKKTVSTNERRIFSRTKARELDQRQLEKVTGGMMARTHCFCTGGGMDDSDWM